MKDEATLIQELQNNETKDKAFRMLMQCYKQRLYWHIRKIVIAHEDANDVLQNTFIKVFKNISKFNQESKLFSWMYRIATNEALTFIAKRAKKSHQEVAEVQSKLVSDLQSDNWFSGEEIQFILQKAVATLPQKQQLVFNMKYFDDLKYDEISEILETSVGALKASYFHAVRKIEQFIKKHQLD